MRHENSICEVAHHINKPMLDKTFLFCYNEGGNIVSKTEYAYTTGIVGAATATYNYTYGNAWKDQLTSFGGQSIVYDASGNPTSYLGATLFWGRGRLLTKYVSGSKTVDMEYDARGIRVGKTRKIGTSVTTNSTYIYDNSGKLRTETQGTATRNYIYGADGIVGYEENNEQFMYRKNFFGDIVAIYQGATKIAEYNYDAWGNCTIVSDYNGYGARNPFRYRGYYFDNDLGMYYLMTRYYDPKIGRFINADSFEYLEPKTINGLNLYAYCGNNPVMLVDFSGTDAVVVTVFGNGGLPIVGHTALFVQDKDGNWYFTQYTFDLNGKNPWIHPFGLRTYIITEQLKKGESFETYLNKYGYTNYQTSYLTGNFAYAAESAKYYGSVDKNKKGKYNNNYNLLYNNCADYVEDVLLGPLDLIPSINQTRDRAIAIPNILHAIVSVIVEPIVDFINDLFD